MHRLKIVRGDDHIEIVIGDNGLGIAEEHLKQVFEPFYTTKKQEDGNIGLGLVICHEIVVQEHSGSLTVNSELGESCKFVIRLPIG